MLSELISKRDKIKQQKDELEVQLNNLNKQILKELLDSEKDELIDTQSNKRVIVVRPERITYNWDGIKTKVGAVRWKKFLAPDKGLLEKAIADGTVKLSEISQFCQSTPSQVHIRVYDLD